ncbi:MAG TPA: CvpA family protein [Pseudogracilibacillus sp.]|nr:CvpA family protein [Pseudogracilibacillus sp.]
MVSFIILLVLFFGFLMGLRRGFVLQLVHLVGFFVSFIVAVLFYKRFAQHLSMWIPYPELSSDSAWAVFLQTMPLEVAFYNAVAFSILFFGVKFLLQIVAYMLDFLASLPVLRSINKLLGAALGFIEMYVITFVILFILALVPIAQIQDRIANSFLAKLMIKYTPILSSLTESLLFTEQVSQLM